MQTTSKDHSYRFIKIYLSLTTAWRHAVCGHQLLHAVGEAAGRRPTFASTNTLLYSAQLSEKLSLQVQGTHSRSVGRINTREQDCWAQRAHWCSTICTATCSAENWLDSNRTNLAFWTTQDSQTFASAGQAVLALCAFELMVTPLTLNEAKRPFMALKGGSPHSEGPGLLRRNTANTGGAVCISAGGSIPASWAVRVRPHTPR